MYHELALAMISSTVVTAFGTGAQAALGSMVETTAPSISSLRRSQASSPVTTPPSSPRSRIWASMARAATTRR